MDWEKGVYLHFKYRGDCMMLTFLLILVIVGICILLLGIRVFFVKGGVFPNLHIEGNKALRDKGIQCANRDSEKCV